MAAGAKSSHDFEHIGAILKNLLSDTRKNSDSELMRVWQLWDEVVGRVVAENAQPEAFKGTLLLVRVASSPWAQQLQFMKKDIIDNVNQALGKELVKDMRFKVG